MIEPEIAFADLYDDMQCAEDYVRCSLSLTHAHTHTLSLSLSLSLFLSLSQSF